MIFGEQQLEAISMINSFVNSSKETAFSLIGSAGTGKTSIMLEIINELNRYHTRFVLCAPTHQAKLVLEKSSGEEVITIHKLLSLSPNIEIEHLDFSDLEFIQSTNKAIEIPTKGVVICDESSMVNDFLFLKLVEICEKRNTKIKRYTRCKIN